MKKEGLNHASTASVSQALIICGLMLSFVSLAASGFCILSGSYNWLYVCISGIIFGCGMFLFGKLFEILIEINENLKRISQRP